MSAKEDKKQQQSVADEAAATPQPATPQSEVHGEPRGKLYSTNWLADIPGGFADWDIVEVVFKNTRKGYYRNSLNLHLEQGDMVAVESMPGHDIGRVTLTGRLVALQMKKARIKPDSPDIKRVFRKARPVDLEKYREAQAREHDTMIRARRIAEELHLNMKIGDVEYQGDGNKAIFYYIADERVDFRQLIKVLAETFHVRIEMKQIGARQEAGRIGGTGPCGRELCCATWMKNFVSVSTGAARYQDISLNPQKLAGMCAKLKCCLNYEVDSYIEAGRKLPSREVVLQTMDGDHFLFKTDILAGLVTYSTDKRLAANLVTITAQRALEIVEMNRRGEKPDSLSDSDEPMTENHQVDLLAGESLTRFDKAKKKKKQKSRGNKAQDNKDAKAANANNQQPANNQQGGNQQASAENRKQRRAEGKQQRQEDKPQQQRQEGKPQQRQEGKQQQRPDNKPQRDAKPQRPDANGDQQKPQDDRQRQRGPKQQRNGGNGNGGQRRRQGKPNTPQQPKQEKANDGGNQ